MKLLVLAVGYLLTKLFSNDIRSLYLYENGLIHAQEFNIPRIELCENLSLDGLTPSIVFQKKANHIFKGEKFIMIRPHANGFNYNKKDVITMTKSIEFAKENGAEG